MINKNFLNLVAAGAALATATLNTGAAQAATASASATAKILAEVTVTKTADLNFGTVVIGAVAGSASVAPGATTATCGGGAICSGSAGAANFNIVGTPNELLTISVPGTASLTGPGGTLTATLAANASSGASLGATGTLPLGVGGSLAVPGNTLAGTYSGTFSVSADYQ